MCHGVRLCVMVSDFVSWCQTLFLVSNTARKNQQQSLTPSLVAGMYRAGFNAVGGERAGPAAPEEVPAGPVGDPVQPPNAPEPGSSPKNNPGNEPGGSGGAPGGESQPGPGENCPGVDVSEDES